MGVRETLLLLKAHEETKTGATRERVEAEVLDFFQKLAEVYPGGLHEELKENAEELFHAIRRAEERLDASAQAEQWDETLQALRDLERTWRDALSWSKRRKRG